MGCIANQSTNCSTNRNPNCNANVNDVKELSNAISNANSNSHAGGTSVATLQMQKQMVIPYPRQQWLCHVHRLCVNLWRRPKPLVLHRERMCWVFAIESLCRLAMGQLHAGCGRLRHSSRHVRRHRQRCC